MQTLAFPAELVSMRTIQVHVIAQVSSRQCRLERHIIHAARLPHQH
jgi:hypothetical protein